MMCLLNCFGFCCLLYKCWHLEIYSFIQFPSTSCSTLLPLPTPRLAAIFQTDVLHCLRTSLEVCYVQMLTWWNNRWQIHSRWLYYAIKIFFEHSMSALFFGFQVVALVCVTLIYNVARHAASGMTLIWAYDVPVHTSIPLDCVLNLAAVLMVGIMSRNLCHVHGRPPKAFSLMQRNYLCQAGDAPLLGLSFIVPLCFDFGGTFWLASQLMTLIIHFGNFGQLHNVESPKHRKEKKSNVGAVSYHVIVY